MALSSYSNIWAPPTPPQTTYFDSFKTEFNFNDCELLLLEAEQQQQTELELLLVEAEQQQQQQLNSYDNNYGGECEFEDNLSNSFIDPYFNPNEFFYSDEYNFNLNFNYDNPSMISLSPQHFDPYPLQKRQKVDEFPTNSVTTLDFCNDEYAPVGGGNIWLPEQIQAPDQVFKYEGNLWLPEQNQVAAAGGGGLSYGNAERKSVSPQSVAARERRRKITEKTSELGKLIPGGSKMNTAEMFQSASKYVKYLQASVSLLQTMHKVQGKKVETNNMETLRVLLQSTTLQEKLYNEEKCLVPIDFVKSLADRHETEFEFDSSIGHDLNQLIGLEYI